MPPISSDDISALFLLRARRRAALRVDRRPFRRRGGRDFTRLREGTFFSARWHSVDALRRRPRNDLGDFRWRGRDGILPRPDHARPNREGLDPEEAGR